VVAITNAGQYWKNPIYQEPFTSLAPKAVQHHPRKPGTTLNTSLAPQTPKNTKAQVQTTGCKSNMIHQPQPQPQPQPVNTATVVAEHPGQDMTDEEQQILLPETVATETYHDYDLDVLAYAATQQYFELAQEESELDVWRRNANGPARGVPRTLSHSSFLLC